MRLERRRPAWDRGGVSEVIGTILTLSITVVLFSSIIAMVGQFPAPGDTVYTDFTATIEPLNATSWDGAFIHITNTGGQRMTGLWTIIVVSVDDTTYILSTQGIQDNRSYGLGHGVFGHRGNDNGDEDWDTGERWTFFRNATQMSQGADVSVVILDQGRNALVWSADIQGNRNMFGPIISNIRADADLRTLKSDPIQYGREFYIFADVYDPDGNLDGTEVYADLSMIMPSAGAIPMSDPEGDGTFIGGPIMGPGVEVPMGYHIAVVRAADTQGMNSIGSARVTVGMDPVGQPNLVIRATDIAPSALSPTNGNNITIAVTVNNYGGWCSGYLNVTDIVGTAMNDISPGIPFMVSQGPTQVTQIISWVATPGGEHTIRAEAVPVDAVDLTPDDNSNHTNLTVLPRILLVDDDNHPSDGTAYDTVGYMKGALDSSDFSYDLYTVAPGKDGPGYKAGQKMLADYDVVIWMTGYEELTTLTALDQQNLSSFVNDDLGKGRGGSLWMIGQYLYADAGIPAGFFNAVLMAADRMPVPSGPTDPLMGVPANPISDEWASDYIPMVPGSRVEDANSSYVVQPAAGAEITFRISDANSSYGDAINYENAASGSRRVFFPWDFSRIRDTSDQTQVAYRVLKWLGNITVRQGDDLAISEQTLEPTYVFFNQVVRVDAVVRNNGENNLTTDIGLFLDGSNSPYTLIESLTIPGGGQSVVITANWTASQLGTHTLKWIVDPGNVIAETNERNNEVPSYVTSGEVFVEFRLLVVDDDGSANNANGTLENDTALVTDSLHRLGYVYESPNGDNTTYVVGSGDGPGSIVLQDYSAVFWITGSAASGLTANDTLALESYLGNNQGMLWLAGDDLWGGVAGANLTGFMGIGSVAADAGLAGTLRGVEGSPISHGMNITITDDPDADRLVPSSGEGVFYQTFAGGSFCAVMHDGGSYKGFTSAFDISSLYGAPGKRITGDNATDELIYMLLRWMGKPDDRNEVRLTEVDYYISDWHPQIGGAYILRAVVNNAGAGDTNVLVRFMDGTTQIGSDSISVTPGAQTTAEMIWRPLFAGQRAVSILVDPVNEVDEVFQWFNNNQTFDIYVYFFWDDMESGSSKWSHSSTVISINGEGPLDFMSSSYSTINTDVSGDWDWSRTSGVQNSTREFHSYPNSYFMEEPSGYFGIKSDVLVAIVLDNSPSMTDRICPDGTGRTYLEVTQDAAAAMVNEFSDASAVGVYDFKGANENVLIGITSLAGAGRQNVINAIYANLDQGNTNTAIWDAIGMGYQAVVAAMPSYPNNYAAVVSLGDGADSQAADSSAFQDHDYECGSDAWAPWGDMHPELGYPTGNYPNHWGKYWFYRDPLPGKWIGAGTHGGAWQSSRRGLLHSDVPIYTVGLALEHYMLPYMSPVAAVPPEYTLDTNTHVTATESGTVEYNFWRIANTSYAEYFYSEDGSNLEDIFTQIGHLINAQGFNQSRASTPLPGILDDDNADKKAVSAAMDLSEYESATFSFWHKYNLLSGGNGGIVGVEVLDGATWKFLYIIPPGAYTGGIYYNYTIFDDFGNPIKWCFNGISGQNTFSWDYVSVDVMPYIEEQGVKSLLGPDHFKSSVRLAMKYVQFGGGTGEGWYIDDVKLDVSRADSNPDNTTADAWRLVEDTWSYGSGWTHSAHSGDHAWWNGDPATGFVRTGIDNSLITMPIDLTNAQTVFLSAYFKFNLNEESGAPPDGFRVEITGDGGVTWSTLNLGIRSSWGVSGTGLDITDGLKDGKAYTGLGDRSDGMYLLDGYWVSAGSLSRLNVNLGPWTGQQVMLRFRMVTNNLDPTQYAHNDNLNFGDPGFGGFYVDDVIVYGETIFG